jgi:hypothetical protein
LQEVLDCKGRPGACKLRLSGAGFFSLSPNIFYQLLMENSAHTENSEEISQNGTDATMGQDAQKGCPARPQRAKRRGLRFGTLSL